MFGRLVYDILFFAIPIAVLALFGISLDHLASDRSPCKHALRTHRRGRRTDHGKALLLLNIVAHHLHLPSVSAYVEGRRKVTKKIF